MEGEKPYSLAKLSQYVGDDQNQIKEMIALFLDAIPPDIDKLKELVDKEEWHEVLKITHRIRPSFDVFEMGGILNVIRKIEHLARENNVEGNMVNYMEELTEKFDKIVLLLREDIEK